MTVTRKGEGVGLFPFVVMTLCFIAEFDTPQEPLITVRHRFLHTALPMDELAVLNAAAEFFFRQGKRADE